MLGSDPDRVAALEALDDASELESFTRWNDAAHAQRVAESSLRIGGMHCANCANTVEAALQGVPGVLEAHVSAAAQCATVRWDPHATRVSLLIASVERAGYAAAPDTAAVARTFRSHEFRTALWRLFVAAFCSMQVMMLAAPAYFAAPGELAPEHKQLLDWGSWLLTLPVMCFSAATFLAGAWRALRRRRIGMDVPVAIGIAVAFIASTGAAFAPGGLFGRDVYFDSLTMFVSFLLAGRFLEMRARHRAEVALEDATVSLPQSVMRLRDDGSVDLVSAKRIRIGDRLRVPLGQAFAADGIVVDGCTFVDESLLTGESRPVAKGAGDTVVAGSVNLQSPVAMRVDRLGADTRYESIVALMRAARGQRPAMLALADRWAAPFLWAVLLLAGGAGLYWSLVDPSRAILVTVSMLIVTCPCALSLAAPSALLAAAGRMGRHGVLLQNLDAVQSLARIQILFVDKTGTLTDGALRCADVRRVGAGVAMSEPAVGAIAASLAGWSSHPLARSLRERFPSATTPWRDVHEVAGQGIQAIDPDGRPWRLGSPGWAGMVALDNAHRAQTCLAREGRALAVFSFDEELRTDAFDAVRDLQADGVEVRLLSGDDSRQAEHIASKLGLASGAGAQAPHDKLQAIRAAQRAGAIVAMVGDGINDAPVLAQADVSFAMGEGALLARTQADGVLLANRLGDLVQARGTARKAMRVVRQNFVWAALYNALCIPLALAGWLPPWAAGLGMASSSLRSPSARCVHAGIPRQDLQYRRRPGDEPAGIGGNGGCCGRAGKHCSGTLAGGIPGH